MTKNIEIPKRRFNISNVTRLGSRGSCGQKIHLGVATGEDLNGPHLLQRGRDPSDRLPQGLGFSVFERVKLDDSEQVIEGLPIVFHLLEAARGCAEEHEARLVRQRVSQYPCIVATHLAPDEHVEILYDEQEPFALLVGKI